MNTTSLVLILLLVGIGIFLFGRGQHVFAYNSGATDKGPSVALAPLAPSEFSGDGVVIFDGSQTPYLVYEETRGGVGTKRLVFTNEPGCEANALPCASALPPSPVTSGEAVHLTGTVEDDRILVQSFGSVASVSGIDFVTPENGQPVMVAGLTIKPVGIRAAAGCTLGVGCFADGIDRIDAEVTYTEQGRSVTKIQSFAQGALVRAGDKVIMPLQISTDSYKFLIAEDTPSKK